MSYRKLNGVNLPEHRQGLIYYTLQNFRCLSVKKQSDIIELCKVIAHESAPALLELLTYPVSSQATALKHYVDHSTLCRYRREFYVRYNEIIKK